MNDSFDLMRVAWLRQCVHEFRDLELRQLSQETCGPVGPLEDLILRVLRIEDSRARRTGQRGFDRRRGSELAERARRLIEQNPEQFDSSIGLARKLGCHPVHLSRSFKKEHGVTVTEFVRIVRTREGLRLLAETDIKVSTVAMIVGFRAKSAFYHAVRSFTGRSPGAWRRDQNGGAEIRPSAP